MPLFTMNYAKTSNSVTLATRGPATETAQYTRGSLLTVRYEKDNTRADLSTARMTRCFKGNLGWTVRGRTLSQTAEAYDLETIVQEFLDAEAKPGVLIAIFYAGHGREDTKNGRGLIIQPSGRSDDGGQIPINDIIYNQFFATDNHAIVFLDCCHAGASFRSEYDYQKEILASCVREGRTPGAGERGSDFSFTGYLTRAVRSFRRDFSIQELRDAIDRQHPAATPPNYSYPNPARWPILLRPRSMQSSSDPDSPVGVSEATTGVPMLGVE